MLHEHLNPFIQLFFKMAKLRFQTIKQASQLFVVPIKSRISNVIYIFPGFYAAV